jgi:large subunit ribosomal protein L5
MDKEQEKVREQSAPKSEKKGSAGGSKKAPARKAVEAKASKPVPKGYVPRLKLLYREKIAGELFKEFSYSSVMQTPTLEKVVVSMGVGVAKENKKFLDAAIDELTLITGQKAVKTKAKKSIANFKIREGQEIGAKVTLRGAMMWEFFDRLINIALPRVKDFRGINQNAFDGHGNYSLGITEQIIFPEIDFDKIDNISGLNVVIVTTAKTDAEAKAFLSKFGMPFRK